jgi:hypothetical protein
MDPHPSFRSSTQLSSRCAQRRDRSVGPERKAWKRIAGRNFALIA